MAAREIKTTLALDGEKQFKAGMDDAYRAMKVLGSEMKLNTAEFGKNEQSIEGLTQKQRTLGDMQKQQEAIVAALTKAVAESAQAYGDSDKKTDAYRVKLNNAKASLANIETQLGQTTGQIDNFGNEVADTEKKTINWGDALSKIGGGLKTAAVATGAAMAAIGTAAIAAGKQIFDLATGTGKFADDLLTMSAQTGISTTSLQEWTYAAQFIDTEVETMTGSMAKMIKQMDAARNGTEASSLAFGNLGISVTDGSGKLRDSEVVFFEAIDALGKVGSETDRDALAMQLFGKSAQDLNPLILAGSTQLRALGQEAQTAGLIMSEEALGNFGAFDDSMNRITSTLSGIGRSIASAFLPAIQSAADGAQEMFSTINQSLKDGLQPEDIETIGKKLGEKLSDGMRKITEYLPQVIKTVTEMLSKLISFAVEYLPKLLPMLMDAAVKLLQGAIKAITDNIAKISEMVTTLIKAFVKFIVDNLPAIINVAIEIILALVKGLSQAIPDIVAALPAIISAIVDGLVKALPQVLELGKNIVTGLWNGIKSMAAWLGDKVGSWIGGVWKDIKSFFGISSPSKLMADTIGKPMAQGIAQGLGRNLGLVGDELNKITPMLNMNVSGKAEQSVTANFSDSALARIVDGLAAVMTRRDDMTIVLNDREFGRAVRKVAMA